MKAFILSTFFLTLPIFNLVLINIYKAFIKEFSSFRQFLLIRFLWQHWFFFLFFLFFLKCSVPWQATNNERAGFRKVNGKRKILKMFLLFFHRGLQKRHLLNHVLFRLSNFEVFSSTEMVLQHSYRSFVIMLKLPVGVSQCQRLIVNHGWLDSVPPMLFRGSLPDCLILHDYLNLVSCTFILR